jgi:hypothetical protein
MWGGRIYFNNGLLFPIIHDSAKTTTHQINHNAKHRFESYHSFTRSSTHACIYAFDFLFIYSYVYYSIMHASFVPFNHAINFCSIQSCNHLSKHCLYTIRTSSGRFVFPAAARAYFLMNRSFGSSRVLFILGHVFSSV